MTFYQAFTVPVPKARTKKAMTAFVMALVDMANRHMEKYQDKFGAEPDTLLVPGNAPLEQLETWFGDVLHVQTMKNPNNMFGVTRR